MITKTLLIRRKACEYALEPADQMRLLSFTRMTIGWIEEFVRDGEVIDDFKNCS